MVDNEKGKGDMSKWKAQKGSEEPVFPEESEQIQFFRIPVDPNAPSLTDEDKTPVARMARNTVDQLDLAEIQRRMRAADVQATELRRAQHDVHLQSIDKAEMETIFKAVSEGDEDTIKSLFTRDLGMIKFSNLQDCQNQITELLGGENIMSGLLDMKKLAAGSKKLAEIIIEMRLEIDGKRPMVVITLTNEIGYGKRSGENVTTVKNVSLKESTPTSSIPKSDSKPGILARLFGRK